MIHAKCYASMELRYMRPGVPMLGKIMKSSVSSAGAISCQASDSREFAMIVERSISAMYNRYILHNDGAPCGYVLELVGPKRVLREFKASGIRPSVLFQTDWDFPSLARNLGWNMRGEDCGHDETDGTVDCVCGKSASTFISEAADFLDSKMNEVIRDKYGNLGEYFGI